MLLWLWRRIVGTPYVPPCQHTYELHEKTTVTGPLSHKSYGPCGVIYVNRCTKCGAMYSHRVEA